MRAALPLKESNEDRVQCSREMPVTGLDAHCTRSSLR